MSSCRATNGNDEIMYCDEATATGSIRFSVIQDLPDAICRVMLASLRVAEVLP